jgi:hypothetical protein
MNCERVYLSTIKKIDGRRLACFRSNMQYRAFIDVYG